MLSITGQVSTYNLFVHFINMSLLDIARVASHLWWSGGLGQTYNVSCHAIIYMVTGQSNPEIDYYYNQNCVAKVTNDHVFQFQVIHHVYEMTYLFVSSCRSHVLQQNMDNKHLLHQCLLTIWFILLSADQPFHLQTPDLSQHFYISTLP